jgi:preprotein translocase SecE subunit
VADEPAQKSDKTKKRKVRNPETFRERAIKAAEQEDKPKRFNRATGRIGRLLRAFFRPFGWLFKKIGSFAPLKWLWRKVLRWPFKLLGRILLPKYVRNSWKELRLVTWPNWNQSRQLTFAVLIFAVIFGASIALVDYGLDKAFRHILIK